MDFVPSFVPTFWNIFCLSILSPFLSPKLISNFHETLRTIAANLKGALPGSMDQLGNKADLTPSPERSSSNRGCLTGETNDVVSSYGFALNRAGFSHSPDTPSKPLQPHLWS